MCIIQNLVNQFDQICNFIVFYNYQKLDFLVVYNWIGCSLCLVDVSLFSQDVYWQVCKQIDLQVCYDLGGGWCVFVEVVNLINLLVISVIGFNKDQLKDIFFMGWMIWFGVNYSFKNL